MKARHFVSPFALAMGLTAGVSAHAQTAANDQAGTATLGTATQERAQILAGDAPTADSTQTGDIMVTGTRIVRPNLKSASPITTVTAAQIKAQGAVNVEEVLNRMGQVTPDSQQVYPSSNGKQKVKLRGLDFNRTLSLIDGQRMAGSESVDLNVIPTSLIERIDVLTGGASSVYGSDAIAGVVNFILKKNFTGLQLAGNYSLYNHTNRANATTPVAQSYGIATPTSGNTFAGGRADLSITYGHNFLDDRLNISVFGEYRQADPIKLRDRDFSGCQIQRDTSSNPLKVNGLSCIVTAASPNGTLTVNGTNYSNVTGSPGTFALSSTIPGYTNGTDREASRGYKRINGGGFLNFKVSPAAELYSSVLYMRDKSQNTFYGPYIGSYAQAASAASAGYTGAPYQVNCNNPLMSASQAQTICGANAGTSAYAPLNIQYGFPGLGGDRSRDTFTNTQTRVTAGVRGQIAEGFKYDVGGVYTENRDIWLTGGLPIYSKILKALDVVNVNGVATCRSVVNGTDPSCVPLNVFTANSGSVALRNYLFNEGLGRSDNQARFYDATANLTADFTRFGIRSPFAEQGLAAAFGLEYRKQEQDKYVNERYTQVYGTGDTHARQDVKEANVEVQLPLAQDVTLLKLLQVNGGYRLSKYDTNSNTFKTWKMEAVYSPIPDITFRVSKNRAQRAPGVNEANQPVSFTNYAVQDPCASVNGAAPLASLQACQASGLATNLYGSTTLLCTDNACRERLNGNEISPEDARTVTYGLVLTPRFLPRFSFSVDHYKIRVNNIIGFNYANFAVTGCIATAQPYYCSLLVRNPDGTLFGGTSTTSGYIQAGVINQYRLFASGWDVSGQYSLPLGPTAGRLDFQFDGTLTQDTGGQNSVVTLRYNCAGYFGPSCGPGTPKWVHTLRTTYSTNDGVFNASLAWRYIDSMITSQNSGKAELGSTSTTTITDQFAKVPVYNYFDLALGLNIAKRLSLTASMNNIFDRMPPVLPNVYSYTSLYRGNSFPARYDTLGRNITVGVKTSF